VRRVLMVTPHFPPDTSAGTHRIRLLAPHLAACGWEPTVVTVDPAGYEGRLDPELASSVPASLRAVRVPAWPVSATRRIGVGDLGLRALTGLRRACRALLTTEPFDALFITIYPTYPALLGPALKRRFGVPFVLDYQDPWVGSWGRDVGSGPGSRVDPKSRVSRALAERLEPRVVRAADAITAVSARTYEEVLARVGDARPRACAAIPIGFDTADVDHLSRHPRDNRWFDRADGLVHLCYVGTVLPAGLGVIDALLGAIGLVRDRSPQTFARMRLHFLGTSNQRTDRAAPRVMALARERGVDDVVREVAPRLDYFDALNVQRQAHGLLLLGSDEPHYTPSKVFPALLSGRPLLAVYHEASSVRDVLDGVDGAAVIAFGASGPDRCAPRIAEAIERLVVTSPQAAPRPMPPGLERWSARSLASRLGDVLDAVASPAAGSRPAA
jgi:glycosyltransferase involved in cell wall biosynthesis